MNDRLIVHDLVASCRLGVHEWEQRAPQQVWIDLELSIDAAAAASQDDVTRAVDYGRLVTLVKQHAEHRAVHLLETLAEGIAALVLATFRVPEVRVRVKKRALPSIDYAAVDITRAVRA